MHQIAVSARETPDYLQQVHSSSVSLPQFCHISGFKPGTAGDRSRAAIMTRAASSAVADKDGHWSNLNDLPKTVVGRICQIHISES